MGRLASVAQDRPSAVTGRMAEHTGMGAEQWVDTGWECVEVIFRAHLFPQ